MYIFIILVSLESALKAAKTLQAGYLAVEPYGQLKKQLLDCFALSLVGSRGGCIPAARGGRQGTPPAHRRALGEYLGVRYLAQGNLMINKRKSYAQYKIIKSLLTSLQNRSGLCNQP